MYRLAEQTCLLPTSLPQPCGSPARLRGIAYNLSTFLSRHGVSCSARVTPPSRWTLAIITSVPLLTNLLLVSPGPRPPLWPIHHVPTTNTSTHTHTQSYIPALTRIIRVLLYRSPYPSRCASFCSRSFILKANPKPTRNPCDPHPLRGHRIPIFPQ